MTIFYRRFIFLRCAIFASILAALPLLSVPCSAKKPKNPKYDKARKATATAAVKPKAKKIKPLAAQPAPPILSPHLADGRWAAPIKKALEELVAAQGKTSLLYDAQRPPVAVLPWDDAAIINDVGDAALMRMIERLDFKFDDAFWRLVPLGYGHQQLRVQYEKLQQEPESSWPHQIVYQQFRRDFINSYQNMCGKAGRKECRVWLTQLLRGFREDEIEAYAQDLVQAEFQRPLETDKIRLGSADARPVIVRGGLAPIPEMKDLCRLLLSFGFDVWVIADDPQWFLQAAVKGYGIDASHAIGIRAKIEKNGRLGSEILDPVPFRGGKAGAIATFIGRSPALTIGADPWDIEMLEFGAGVRLLLDKGDGALRRFAEGKNWLIQPAFNGASAGAESPIRSDRD